MSALGQKQTFAAQNGMSALPLIADVAATFASTKTPELSPEGQMATNQIDQAACFPLPPPAEQPQRAEAGGAPKGSIAGWRISHYSAPLGEKLWTGAYCFF